MDAMGNLFVAHYGMRQIEALNPMGQVIPIIRAAISQPAIVPLAVLMATSFS